jgi:prevent-host-death family protein
MKIIGIKEAKAQLSECLDIAQRDRVLITRHGRPAALVIGVEGEDLEQVILGSDEEFWRTLEERRKRPATLTSDDIRREFGIPTEGGQRQAPSRGARRKPTRRRRTG